MSMRFAYSLVRGLAAVALVGTVACTTHTDGAPARPDAGGSSGGADSGATGACTDADIEGMFGRVCSIGGCHSAADQKAGLDLESPNLRERLVERVSAECGPLIIPGNGAGSLLVSIMAPNPECGPTMPPTLPLVPEDVQCVSSWIDAMPANFR